MSDSAAFRNRRAVLAGAVTALAATPGLATSRSMARIDAERVSVVGSIAALAALPAPAPGAAALLTEAGRAGLFVWRTDIDPRQRDADPLNVIFVPSRSDASGQGCWTRVHDGVIDVRWAGARADPEFDNGPAINACLAVAATGVGSVHIPSGNFGVGQTIRMPSGARLSGAGVGRVDFVSRSNASTTLVAIGDLTAMIDAPHQSIISDLGLNGRDRAHIGIIWRKAARPNATNIEALRFRAHAFLFDQTQNGTFVNLCFRFNASGICLMNGARNNVFVNATGEVNERWYKGDYRAATLFTVLTDFGDPFGVKTSKRVTRNGNDLNRFIGGIFERAVCAVRVIDRDAMDGPKAVYGRTSFHDSELTTELLLDSEQAPAWRGGLLLRDATIINNWTDGPRTRGTAGSIDFDGGVRFWGGALANRGIGLRSNVLELAATRSHVLGSDPGYRTLDGARYVFDADGRRFALSCPTPSSGMVIPVEGGLTTGNRKVVGATTRLIRPVMQIQFAVTGPANGDAIDLYVELDAAPWRRKIGSYGPGAHDVLHPCTGGENGIALLRGSGPVQFAVSSVRITLF